MTKRKAKPAPMVLVRWVDASMEVSSHWQDGTKPRLCDEWLNDPAAFCGYLGQPPSPDMSVDRIDNARGYEPGNVRWATSLEQARNRTVCVPVEFQGRTYSSVSEFVEWLAGEIKVNRQTLRREVQRLVAAR